MVIDNKISADLQFIGSSVREINMTNNIIVLEDIDNRSFSIDLDLSDVHEDEDDNNFLIGIVRLSVDVIVTAKNKRKTKLHILLEGCFKSINQSMKEEEFAAMLYINGGSTLYSIARSLISNISANTYEVGKLLLPMINMVEFLKNKLKTTDQPENNKKMKGDK